MKVNWLPAKQNIVFALMNELYEIRSTTYCYLFDKKLLFNMIIISTRMLFDIELIFTRINHRFRFKKNICLIQCSLSHYFCLTTNSTNVLIPM